MGLQEFPSKPVNKGGVIVGTVNGPTEIAIGAQDSYLVADSTTTPGAKWQTYRKYNTVQLTSGTSWTVPATVEMIDVLLIGGGGAATTRTASGTAGGFTSGGSGGGGAIVYCRDYAVTPGATITYSIGAGSNAAAASGAVNTETFPAAAGNTTFGVLTAPGSMNKIGNVQAFTYTTQQSYRGIFDLVNLDNTSSNTSTDNMTTNRGWWANNYVAYMNMTVIGHHANNSSSAYPFVIPFYGTAIGTGITGNSAVQNRQGIPNLFKLTAAYTAPQGGTATNELGSGGTRVAGWGGYGGDSNNSNPTLFNSAFHGGGQGVAFNSSTTSGRGSTGGSAAANSGAGGGAGHACSSGASPIQAAIGGNGGSGVIFIGYWA